MKNITGWDILVVVLLGAVALNRGAVVLLLCIIAFVLWLYVRPRKTVPTVAVPSEAKPGRTPEQVESDFASGYGFLVGNNTVISLDMDIDLRKNRGHFYIRGESEDRSASTSSEYEYRLEGTDVLVRELHSFNEFMGDPRSWKIRDGVVLEAQLREAGIDDDDLGYLKERVEWLNLPSCKWDGFKYFVISEKVPTPEARRFFRQELERLRLGLAAFAQLNIKPDIEALQKCGITWGEFHSEAILIDRLEALLGEGT